VALASMFSIAFAGTITSLFSRITHSSSGRASSAPCVHAPPQPRLTRLRSERISGRLASHCGVSSLLPLSITRIESGGQPPAIRLSTHWRV